MIETPEWCVDDRHGAPCPQPPRGDRCEACEDEGCDPVARVAADTAIEAVRTRLVRGVHREADTMRDIEDDRPEPDSLAAIAVEHGVELAALRAALAESHPDASPAEVIAAARAVQGRVPPRAGARLHADQEGDR